MVRLILVMRTVLLVRRWLQLGAVFIAGTAGTAMAAGTVGTADAAVAAGEVGTASTPVTVGDTDGSADMAVAGDADGTASTAVAAVGGGVYCRYGWYGDGCWYGRYC